MTETATGETQEREPEPEPVWPDALVADRVSRVRQALRIGGDRFSLQAANRAGAAVERAQQRVRLGSEATVVAFAGATGSGKSSLFNALAQMDVSEVAARRPTTSEPNACVWGVDIADPLLDWLGVEPRNRTQRESVLDADREAVLAGLVLLDLPDHDSAVLSHQLAVDRLIDLVDLLVWVVDPQKYADDSAHTGYLRSLAGRQDTMLIVLNQVDRLDETAERACRHDLRRLLEADGLASVGILATSVSRGDGITELRNQIAEVVRGRRSATERARADLDDALQVLRADLGEHRPEWTPVQVTEGLVHTLGDAWGLPVLLDTVTVDYRRQAARWLSCPFSRVWWRNRRDSLRGPKPRDAGENLRTVVGAGTPAASPMQSSRVEIAFRDVVDELGKDLPERWAEDLRVIAWAEGEDLPDTLDQALEGVDLSFPRPRWWRVLGAVQWIVALSTVLGVGWLAWSGISQLLGRTVTVVPLPVVLGVILGGLAFGSLLSVTAQGLVAVIARRRCAAIETRFVELVTDVVEDRLMSSAEAVLNDLRQVHEILDGAPLPDASDTAGLGTTGLDSDTTGLDTAGTDVAELDTAGSDRVDL